MDEQVVFVRNRKGAYHHVTLSHYEENSERDGLELIDEREWLIRNHQPPVNPTVRASDVMAGEAPVPVAEEPKRRGRKPKVV